MSLHRQRFAHGSDLIARVLREAGADWRNRRIVFTADECASIVARYQQGESCGLIAKTFARHPRRHLASAVGGRDCAILKSVSQSEREQVRDLWMPGLPYMAIGVRLGFTKRRVSAILTKMRQCGEIGVRPVALRSLQAEMPSKPRLPANAIPAVLLQMAQGMSYRDIARHWQMSRGEIYGCSFADDGTVLASPELSDAARTALGIQRAPPLPNLRDVHRANLAAHRTRHGFSGGFKNRCGVTGAFNYGTKVLV